MSKRLPSAKPRELNEIYQRIFRESMPELYANPAIDWEIYYRSYVDTYLQRDIHDLTQVADDMQFYNFMTIAAAQTSKPVIYAELAAAAGISAPTAKERLSIFAASHIISRVQPYHNNVLKRVVKMPLLHFSRQRPGRQSSITGIKIRKRSICCFTRMAYFRRSKLKRPPLREEGRL